MNNFKEIFVFGDAHSNHESVKKLLSKVGLLDGTDKRLRPEVGIFSIGDLANCVMGSRDEDLKCLDIVGTIIDGLIIGNHEAPYLKINHFGGFFWYPEINERINYLLGNELIIPCLAFDSVLISHAGITPELGVKYGFESAEHVSQTLADALYNPMQYSDILGKVGYSRGGYGTGGILWSDWSENKYRKFTQIVGHSRGDDIRRNLDNVGEAHSFPVSFVKNYQDSYCIDLNCNSTGFSPCDQIAGAWLKNDGWITFTKLYDY